MAVKRVSLPTCTVYDSFARTPLPTGGNVGGHVGASSNLLQLGRNNDIFGSSRHTDDCRHQSGVNGHFCYFEACEDPERHPLPIHLHHLHAYCQL